MSQLSSDTSNSKPYLFGSDMLIPSIDLLDGKVVQLVKGEKKALEFDSPDPWIERFSHFPIVQLIDLDAAMRTARGHNRELIEYVATRLPVQVGGGIRDLASAQRLLDTGARKLIFGSSLFRDGAPDFEFAQQLHALISPDQLIFAIDSKSGQVAIAGWKRTIPLTPDAAIDALEAYCGAFLYTHIDSEGTLSGFPLGIAERLKAITSRHLIVAGGIRDMHEIAHLDACGIDSVVGMAIYTGMLPSITKSDT
jgi:phosphoribosylformimino-5-aminoimidazole carboxamide ribotide isomerase